MTHLALQLLYTGVCVSSICMGNQMGEGKGGRRKKKSKQEFKNYLMQLHLIIHACLSLSPNLVLSPILSKLKEKISLMIKNQPKKGI